MADERPPASDQDIEGILQPEEPQALEHGQPVPPPPAEPAPRPAPAAPGPDPERLNQALQTIEALQREVAGLRQQSRPTMQPVAGEVPIEMEEVLPGRRIPKDPSRRAIRLSADDLVRVGWNEDPARAINTLANAFFHHICEVVPQIAMHYSQQDMQARAQGALRQDSFYREFPDLRDFTDLAQIVEQQAISEGRIQGLTQAEWNREVGSRVRQRIAAMRGISLDQYNATAGTGGGAPRTSRAVTAPPARGSRQAAVDAQQREIDDLLEGRI